MTNHDKRVEAIERVLSVAAIARIISTSTEDEWKQRAQIIAKAIIKADPATELLADLMELAPFELVQGDAIHRLCPGSRQVVNSCAVWVVSRDGKSAHKMRTIMQRINEALTPTADKREG